METLVIKFPLKVMLVDDDKDVLTLFKMFFSKYDDFEIIVYSDPVDAFQELTKGECHAVITDLTMPGLHGENFIRDVMSLKQGIYISVLSGADSMMTIHSWFRAGAQNYIKKPVDKVELKKVLYQMKEHFEKWNKAFMKDKKAS